MFMAPESFMPVVCKEDVYWLVVKAGLNLAVLVNELLLEFLKLLVLYLPHCHKALLQPGGGLYLLLANS